MTITRENFGRLPDGRNADIFTLGTQPGVTVRITNYGAAIVSILAPDRDGKIADICLGCDSLEGYLAGVPYFGAICGRYANRIAGGAFTLNGRRYRLATNNGPNSLHGGSVGFDKKLWSARIFDTPRGQSLELSTTSPDGEEGYPGNLSVKVIYTLTPPGDLSIEYWATTDQDTVVNLTNHAYFNLAGEGSGDVLGHELALHADAFTPVDANLIPTGEIRRVALTSMDFTCSETIGARIDKDDEQLKFAGGYDHNWIIRRGGPGLVIAARVREPRSGRVLEMLTTEPGVQFYAGNFLGKEIGKGGKTYCRRGGLCLEAQHFPDSPNHPEFPSTVLKPGQTYRQTTVYRFR